MLKRGCLLYFANDKAAVDGIEHRKGAFVLNGILLRFRFWSIFFVFSFLFFKKNNFSFFADCHIVKYAKEKRDMFTVSLLVLLFEKIANKNCYFFFKKKVWS